jgi:hypothetical protein
MGAEENVFRWYMLMSLMHLKIHTLKLTTWNMHRYYCEHHYVGDSDGEKDDNDKDQHLSGSLIHGM